MGWLVFRASKHVRLSILTITWRDATVILTSPVQWEKRTKNAENRIHKENIEKRIGAHVSSPALLASGSTNSTISVAAQHAEHDIKSLQLETRVSATRNMLFVDFRQRESTPNNPDHATNHAIIACILPYASTTSINSPPKSTYAD